MRQPPQNSRKSLDVFEQLSTAVLVADDGCSIVRSNPAAENLLELSAGKMKGMKLPEVFAAAPEIVRLIKSAQAENRAYTERDIRFLTAQLNQLIVDCTVSPMSAENATAPYIIIEMASVERHQRIQLEEAMLTQNQATKALMRGLAHEIKNPLGGIRGAAQLLERRLLDISQTEYTQIIIGEADRLRNLVDRMLGPRGERQQVMLNIHEVLEHVRQVVQAEISQNIKLVRDYDPSLPEIWADRDELIQAFLNLVRNAAQELEVSGDEIILRTRARRSITILNKFHRLMLSVEIIDNGPGVDEEIAESIFFPMVSGHADGSGLGLPLSQGIVHRHGGLIGFVSEPGQTVFTVWLPLEAENEASE